MRTQSLAILVCSVSILVFGCSKSLKSDSLSLKGTWTGEEAGRSGSSTATLVVEGTTMEFHGANSKDWYKATFSLREDTAPTQLVSEVTDCPVPKYIGKTAYAIYELTGDSLTLTGNEPGNPAVPESFDAPRARKIVFKRK